MAKKSRAIALAEKQVEAEAAAEAEESEKTASIDAEDGFMMASRMGAEALKDKLSSVGSLEKMNAQLSEEVSHLTDELSDKISEVEHLRQEAQALRAEVSDLKEQVQKLTSDNDQHLLKISELTFENAKLKTMQVNTHVGQLPGSQQNIPSRQSPMSRMNPSDWYWN